MPITKAQSQLGEPVRLGRASLTIETVVDVARHYRPVAPIQPDSGDAPADAAFDRLLATRAWVEHVLDGEPRAYYGINTGFGVKAGRVPLANSEIPWVSRNLIVSHASGLGPALPPEVVRAAMLIRANSLAEGYSGVRPELVNTLVAMLNNGLIPVIPEFGSVGSSGDLAPLSHLAQALSARPEADEDRPPLPEVTPDDYDESGQILIRLAPEEKAAALQSQLPGAVPVVVDGVQYLQVSGAAGMAFRGVDRLILGAKEGLALNNGTTFSTALAALALFDAENIARHVEVTTAMALETLLGFRDAFLPHVQAVRGQAGQVAAAARIMRFLQGSNLADGDIDLDPRYIPPQDAYSLRVAPQVLGAIWDTLAFIRQTISREINAVTDNPLIFPAPAGDPLHLPRGYRTVSGGNFHGTPIGYAMDFLAIVMTDLGSMCERRVYRLTNHKLNHGLPSMLIEENSQGQTSGMMIPQYVASALVSDCKTLSHPDSVDSIPTSAGREDYVSMSMNAARHARAVIANIERIVAIELLCVFLGLRQRLSDLAAKRDDPGYRPESKSLVELTRVDEQILFLRRAGQQPQMGQASQAALDAVAACLYPEGNALPRLGEGPTMIDRFTQPYLNRLVGLVQGGGLVTAVYQRIGLKDDATPTPR